ncbi:NADase-type glycan-binding domain-containing protein [uncultured Roseibium sp.]|uniref:NADase-type glycan-binding domain-containing protein n=1 Tax=uncultured Roseibium sp. TaxID=1936171 RepID=UPI003216E6F7
MASAPASAADRVALVVGNGAYRYASELPNPPNDAALMGRTLADLGFDVIQVIDGDQRALLNALTQFGRAAQNADIALVFYAGHGVQVGGRNWLLPIDVHVEASTDLPGQAVRAEDLLEIMDASGARLKLVFLDACRNNPLPRSLTRGTTRGLARLDAGTAGTMIAFATAPGDVASDGTGANSPFTTALARYIRQPGLEVRQMMGKVREAVYDETGKRQLPWVNEALIGEFYFAGTAQAVTAPVASASVATAPAAADSDSSASAFALAEKVGTVAAYDAFLSRYSDGFYADIARAARQKLVGEGASAGANQASAPEPADQGKIVVVNTSPAHLDPPDYRSGACAVRTVGGAQLTYCSSSVLDPQYGNRYGPGNLTDGDPATAWVEGVGGAGTGERILVKFGSERPFAGIDITNGYTKNRSIFAKNGRVRNATVKLSDGSTYDLPLSDTMNVLRKRLQRPVAATWMEFRIDGVYDGSKYQDTAISELIPVFAD